MLEGFALSGLLICRPTPIYRITRAAYLAKMGTCLVFAAATHAFARKALCMLYSCCAELVVVSRQVKFQVLLAVYRRRHLCVLTAKAANTPQTVITVAINPISRQLIDALALPPA